MARPLRIQYPDAYYHVMNRGNRGEAIFSPTVTVALFWMHWQIAVKLMLSTSSAMF